MDLEKLDIKRKSIIKNILKIAVVGGGIFGITAALPAGCCF